MTDSGTARDANVSRGRIAPVAASRYGVAMIAVDARGHRCPTPTLRLRRAVERAAPGASLVLLADDPLARVDVPHFAAASGLELVEVVEADGCLRFVVRKP